MAYRTLVETSHDLIWSVDALGRWTFLNAAVRRIYGYELAEMLGRPFTDFQTPEQAKKDLETFARIKVGTPHFNYETVHLRKDGSPVWLNFNAVVLHDKQGAVLGTTGTAQDITERKRAEQTRDHSLSLRRATLESTADGILVVNSTGKIETYNRVFARMWRVPDEVLAAKDDNRALQFALEQLSEPQQSLDKVRHLYAHPQEESFDTLLLKDGRVFERYSRPQFIDGILVGRVWSFRDITERKQTEKALRESEEKFQAVFAQSPLAIVLTTLPEGRVADANAAAELLLGRKRDEVRGKTTLELNAWVDPADRANYLQALQREGTLNGYEVRMRRKDGVEITVLYSGRVVHIGGQAYALNSMLDINARKQAEAELRRAKQMVTDIVESVEGIVWEADAQTLAFTYVSPQAERMLGYSLARWTEEPTFWPDHIHPDDRERTVNYCRQNTQERRDHEFEYRMLAADGRVVQMRDIVTVVVEQNQAVRLRGLMLDITKQKMLEEHLRQTQKMEAIGQLSGGVAHDLNNLLTVIKGHIGLLRVKGQVSPEISEPLQQIDLAADRAAKLTRQLLTLSRQQVMQLVGLNLNGVVLSLTKMLRRLLSEHIEMSVECVPQPLLIRADEGMVEQVLLNLVVNARDALPLTGRLRISTESVDIGEPEARSMGQGRPGAFVCLAVSDNGTGIAGEILPRIFEPFFTTKGIGKGTGLGLATVYGIMQQHEGWITVESAVGRGTIFRAYFPRLASAVPATPVDQGSSPIRGGHEGILLVEDEPAVRLMAEVALASLGYRVFPAAGGLEALQVWETHRHEIELLLTDMVMPNGLTGRDLALRLRARAPQLPVIYMSGHNREMAGRNFALSEGSNYLPKPFDLTSLASLVRASLDRGASNPPFAIRPV